MPTWNPGMHSPIWNRLYVRINPTNPEELPPYCTQRRLTENGPVYYYHPCVPFDLMKSRCSDWISWGDVRIRHESGLVGREETITLLRIKSGLDLQQLQLSNTTELCFVINGDFPSKSDMNWNHWLSLNNDSKKKINNNSVSSNEEDELTEASTTTNASSTAIPGCNQKLKAIEYPQHLVKKEIDNSASDINEDNTNQPQQRNEADPVNQPTPSADEKVNSICSKVESTVSGSLITLFETTPPSTVQPSTSTSIANKNASIQSDHCAAAIGNSGPPIDLPVDLQQVGRLFSLMLTSATRLPDSEKLPVMNNQEVSNTQEDLLRFNPSLQSDVKRPIPVRNNGNQGDDSFHLNSDKMGSVLAQEENQASRLPWHQGKTFEKNYDSHNNIPIPIEQNNYASESLNNYWMMDDINKEDFSNENNGRNGAALEKQMAFIPSRQTIRVEDDVRQMKGAHRNSSRFVRSKLAASPYYQPEHTTASFQHNHQQRRSFQSHPYQNKNQDSMLFESNHLLAKELKPELMTKVMKPKNSSTTLPTVSNNDDPYNQHEIHENNLTRYPREDRYRHLVRNFQTNCSWENDPNIMHHNHFQS